MSTVVIVGVVTALMALVVVATRWRFRARSARPGGWLLQVNTVAGLVGLAGWTGYLATGQLEVGIGSLFLVWLAALAGVALIPRQLSGGRHAAPAGSSRLRDVVLVVLALGMVVGVAWFTWAYLVAAV